MSVAWFLLLAGRPPLFYELTTLANHQNEKLIYHTQTVTVLAPMLPALARFSRIAGDDGQCISTGPHRREAMGVD